MECVCKVLANHFAWNTVDGWFARREVEAREGESSDAVSRKDLDRLTPSPSLRGMGAVTSADEEFIPSVLHFMNDVRLCPHLDAVGYIGVVASLFDTIGVVVSIANGDTNGFTIGQNH